MTIVLHWWSVPVAVTVLCLMWAMWPRERRGDYLDGLDGVFICVVGVVISLAAWLIGVLCK